MPASTRSQVAPPSAVRSTVPRSPQAQPLPSTATCTPSSTSGTAVCATQVSPPSAVMRTLPCGRSPSMPQSSTAAQPVRASTKLRSRTRPQTGRSAPVQVTPPSVVLATSARVSPNPAPPPAQPVRASANSRQSRSSSVAAAADHDSPPSRLVSRVPASPATTTVPSAGAATASQVRRRSTAGSTVQEPPPSPWTMVPRVPTAQRVDSRRPGLPGSRPWPRRRTTSPTRRRSLSARARGAPASTT